MADQADIDNRFDYRNPDEAKVPQHQTIRNMTKNLAIVYNESLPEGREKAVAFTKLEEAMFWANAAIARS